MKRFFRVAGAGLASAILMGWTAWAASWAAGCGGSGSAGTPGVADAAVPDADSSSARGGDGGDGGDAGSAPCQGAACRGRSCAADGGVVVQCGPDSNENCCASIAIPGGGFVVNLCDVDADGGCDAGGSSSVSPFALDKYEVTVGRFARFVDDGFGQAMNPPAENAGAHRGIERSGWDSTWNAQLETDPGRLKKRLLLCAEGANLGTWLEDRRLPMTCVTWYEAFAFCIYDGGRLPTEQEWVFAATGGSEQRPYPWGSTVPDTDAGPYANYCKVGAMGVGPGDENDGWRCSETTSPLAVATFAPTRSKFGNADLAGNAFEYVFDWWRDAPPFPCTDCAAATQGSSTVRVMHGGSWKSGPKSILNSSRYQVPPDGRLLGYRRLSTIGLRCAHDT